MPGRYSSARDLVTIEIDGVTMQGGGGLNKELYESITDGFTPEDLEYLHGGWRRYIHRKNKKGEKDERD